MQCLASTSRLREGFDLLDRLPTDMLPHSFPVHNTLREACRVAGDDGMVAAVSDRIDGYGLTNISPEATILVADGHGGSESVAHFSGTYTPDLASVINDLVHDCTRQGIQSADGRRASRPRRGAAREAGDGLSLIHI